MRRCSRAHTTARRCSSTICGASSAIGSAPWSATARISTATRARRSPAWRWSRACRSRTSRRCAHALLAVGACAYRHAAHPARGRVPPVARRISARIRRDHPRAPRPRRRQPAGGVAIGEPTCAAPARHRSRAIWSTCARGSSRHGGTPRRCAARTRLGAGVRRAASERRAALRRPRHVIAWTPRATARASPAFPTVVVTAVLALERPSATARGRSGAAVSRVPRRRGAAGARRRHVAGDAPRRAKRPATDRASCAC